jgi:hypothetical protein
MSKTSNTVMGMAFCAAAGLLAASGSARAQDNPCQGTAEHRLQEYGLTLGDLTNVEWMAQRSGFRQEGPIVSYNMWSQPKTCGTGNLVIAMTSGCYITTVYTQGGCTVKGVPSY